MMNKKIVFGGLIFTLLLFVLPLALSLLFSNQRSGRIEVNQEIDAPYLKSEKQFMLIYFGYVGCAKVCTPILDDLDALYCCGFFKELHPLVDVCFVNLKEEVQFNQPRMFAQAFNPDFKGFYLSRKEIMSIDREFNLYFSRTLGDVNEMDHSDYLYLVQRKPNGRLMLKTIYSTHPIHNQMIADDIKNLLSEGK